MILLASVLFSLFAALRGSAHWEDYLQFFNATPFKISDPLFDRDIGFYIFQIPFLKNIYRWLMTVLAISAAASAFLYLLRRSFQFIPPSDCASPRRPETPGHSGRRPILVGTWGAWLELSDLLFTKRGVVFGPGYTDVTTQISGPKNPNGGHDRLRPHLLSPRVPAGLAASPP